MAVWNAPGGKTACVPRTENVCATEVLLSSASLGVVVKRLHADETAMKMTRNKAMRITDRLMRFLLIVKRFPLLPSYISRTFGGSRIDHFHLGAIND
jgi:hypothetical protein